MIERRDVVIAGWFAVAGAVIGTLTLVLSPNPDFYQAFMPELVYWACGHGMVRAPQSPPELLDFFFWRARSFDCGSLAAPVGALPTGIFTYINLYFSMIVAGLWRILPIDYRSLVPLVALLVAGYTSGCYALVRLFFPRRSALIGAVVLTLSPIAIGMILSIRDYSKAPFFIWSFVLLVMTLRAAGLRAAVLSAVGAGAVVGIGCGFRADTIIMLPIGVVMLALGFTWHGAWLRRAVAIPAFVVAILVLAAPFLLMAKGGGFGTLLMQGLSEPYRAFLDLGKAPYDFGARYSDELVLASIAADLSADDPGWDSREGVMTQSMSQSVSRSGPYVLGWLPYFSGDVATQALKSAMWITGMPTLAARDRVQTDWGLPMHRVLSMSRGPQWVYFRIAHPLLPWLGALGLVVFLWRVAAVRPAEAIALGVALAVMLGYTVVQFSVRHIFHLEFVWVIAILALCHAPFQLRALRRVAAVFLPICAICVVAILSGRYGAVVWQEHALHRAYAEVLALPRSSVTTRIAPSTGGKTLLMIDVPEAYRAMVASPSDSMDDQIAGRGPQWDVRASADRLLLTIGGAACTQTSVTLSTSYERRPGAWQRMDQNIGVAIRPEGPTQVLLTAYYRPLQNFAGLLVPEAATGCISKVERIDGRSILPLVLTTVLMPDWATQPMHRGFGGFPIHDLKPSTLPY